MRVKRTQQQFFGILLYGFVPLLAGKKAYFSIHTPVGSGKEKNPSRALSLNKIENRRNKKNRAYNTEYDNLIFFQCFYK
jgi:hypothetical protein